MSLNEYFQQKQGRGVLATADRDGRVDAAIYSRPYVVDDRHVAFIVADRLTRKNLLSNPHAAYLFMEPGEDFTGKRLFLTMTKELKGKEVTEEGLSEKYLKACREYSHETLSVMYFRVDEVLPLVVEGK